MNKTISRTTITLAFVFLTNNVHATDQELHRHGTKEIMESQSVSQKSEPSVAKRSWSWKNGMNTIIIDELKRTFLFDLPADLRPGAALVMVFHGYGDSPKAIREYAGFTPLVAKCGFVAVYPQGTRDANGTSCFNMGYDGQKHMKADDAKFARELAARLVSDLGLDPRSVFATGMSNGGDTCYLLACQPQPFVRAIAPVAGCMMLVWTNSFMLPTRLSVMEVHGTSDGITHWNGDLPNHDGYGAYLGTEAVMDFWIRKLALEKSSTMEIGGGFFRRKAGFTRSVTSLVDHDGFSGGAALRNPRWPPRLARPFGQPRNLDRRGDLEFLSTAPAMIFRILFCPPCAS